MKTWWHRLRGGLGVGLLWGGAWFLLGATWFGLRLAGPAWFGTTMILASLIGVAGVVSGFGFSFVLGLAGRRVTLDELTYLRVASLGALGSMVVWAPLIVMTRGAPVVPILSIFGALGAVSSAGTLAIARASEPSQEQLEGNAENPSIRGD